MKTNKNRSRFKLLIATLVLTKFIILLGVLVAWKQIGLSAHTHSVIDEHEEGISAPSQSSGIQGADVSHYQEKIRWAKLDENSNIEFVFIKATEGISMVDHRFNANWKDANKTNLICGAYHFFLPNISVKQQFQNYKRKVVLKKGNLVPLLDVERDQGLNQNELNKRIKQWLNLAEAHYGVKPLIYTTQRFYNTYLKNRFDEYEFVIARYNTKRPYMLDARKVKFWQYTDRGRLPGISGNVDRQNFSGGKKDLMKYTLE